MDRLGMVTGSACSAVFATVKSGEAATRANLRMDLVLESILQRPTAPSFAETESIAWGKEQEPFARMAWEMHHGIDIDTQIAHQQAIGQITRDKFSPAPHQVFNTFGPSPADPYVKALLQGRTRKASANKAARAGDQNLHQSLQML